MAPGRAPEGAGPAAGSLACQPTGSPSSARRGAALKEMPGAGSPARSEPGPGLPPRISRVAEVWKPAGRIRASFPGAAGSRPGAQGAQGPQLRVLGEGRRRERHQSRSSGGGPRWPVLLRELWSHPGGD